MIISELKNIWPHIKYHSIQKMVMSRDDHKSAYISKFLKIFYHTFILLKVIIFSISNEVD